MATLQGVYSASVLDNRDREGQARVMVRVPGIAETGIWARLATMMAGRDRGTLFVPDVGDEVPRQLVDWFHARNERRHACNGGLVQRFDK